MNKRIAFVFLIIIAIFFYACQKNIDVFVPTPGQTNAPDTTWYSSITSTMPVSSLQNNLVITPFNDSVILSNATTTLTTASGLQCTFPANCCVNSAGQIVTGKINVQSLLIKNKGDIILMNKPTVSNSKPLVSGAEIFINLIKEGSPVQLVSGTKLLLKYTDTINNKLKLFFGDETNPAQFNWLPNTDSANNYISTTPQAFQIYTNHLRWINCDYFYDTTGSTQSTITAILPSNYTNANTMVFVVFNDIRTVLNLNADITTKKFISTKVPNGKAVTLIAISAQANDFYLGKTIITTGSNTTSANQNVNITPTKTSLANIKSYLSTL